MTHFQTFFHSFRTTNWFLADKFIIYILKLSYTHLSLPYLYPQTFHQACISITQQAVVEGTVFKGVSMVLVMVCQGFCVMCVRKTPLSTRLMVSVVLRVSPREGCVLGGAVVYAS